MKKFCLAAYFVLSGTLAAGAQEGAPMARPSAGMQAQWQLTVDVIKSKVQALVDENTGLTTQHQSIIEQDRKLQQSIQRQIKDNEALRKYLDQRKGRTDQQIAVGELEAQVASLKSRLPDVEQAAREAQKNADAWVRRLDELRIKVSDIELHQAAQREGAAGTARNGSGSRELDNLREMLDQQKAAEADLEKKLSTVDAHAVDPELKMLEDKVAMLRHEKARLMRVNSKRQNTMTSTHERYAAMVRHKLELENEVRGFESKIAALKDPAKGPAVSWDLAKKQLVHDIVRADARNKKMREQVNNLREDIGVLKDQINSRQKLLSYGGDPTKVYYGH